MAPLKALGAVLKRHATAATVGGAITGAGAVGGGLVVGAALLNSGSPRLAGGAVGEATDLADLPADRRRVVDGLRRVIESSHALLDIGGPGDDPARILLWGHDDHQPGHVNRNEAMALVHSRLLGTIYAIHAPAAEGEPAPPVPTAVLFSPDVVGWLRSAPGSESRVVATNVQAMRISRLGANAEGERLRVRLTWAAPGTDQAAEGGVGTAFTVTLPAVHRSR